MAPIVSIPAERQGATLFGTARIGRVYLFGPYSGPFGYREGSRKLISDAIGVVSMLLDLATDPGVTLDVASTQHAAARSAAERLAVWVQYQERFYRRVFERAGIPLP